MLVGKELEMYQVQGKKVQIYLNDGSELVGMCTEFSSAYDNDPEEASITLHRPLKDGKELPWETEVMEHEIKEIKIWCIDLSSGSCGFNRSTWHTGLI